MMGRKRLDAFGHRLSKDASYIAMTSFLDGRHVVREGSAFSGGHPTVVEHPSKFVPLGTPPGEIRRLRVARTITPELPRRPRVDMTPAYECVKAVSVGRDSIRKGDLVHAAHPWVRDYPQAFRPIEQPPASGVAGGGGRWRADRRPVLSGAVDRLSAAPRKGAQ